MHHSVTSNRRSHSGALSERDERARIFSSVDPDRVLIVDSDVAASTSLELMLHASGHSETRVAYSGSAAVAIAAVFAPSVVFLEIELLDMSGYEVARQLRGQARRQSLRLIALTSNPEHAGRELARIAGFECYLLKPVANLNLQNILHA